MVKFRKYGVLLTVVISALMICGSAWAGGAVNVSTFDGLKAVFTAGGEAVLTADITVPEVINVSQDVIIDLNGHTITNTVSDAIVVKENGSLEINDSAGGGTIIGASPLTVKGDQTENSETAVNSTITLNAGTVTTQDFYGVFVVGNGATFNMNGGAINGTTDEIAGILGNGTAKNWGTEINITGGTIDAGPDGIVVYHPQRGTLNISGGEFTGHDGVQFKGGTLEMSGGSITTSGVKPDNLEDDSNGSVSTGAAVSFVSNSGYAGYMELDISGSAKLKSEASYAIWEDTTIGGAQQTIRVDISSGEISGTVSGAPNAMYFKNRDHIEDFAVTGGTYNSDPASYVEEPYVVKQESGKYKVVPAGVVVNPSVQELILDIAPEATLSVTSDISETFVWESDNETIVTVDEDGVISAVDAGKTLIKATGQTSGAMGSCEVTVRAAESVSVAPKTLELEIGKTGTVTATKDAKETIIWSSSNNNIATVTDGTVTAVKAGIAVISAKGEKSEFLAGCTVTVTDPTKPDPIPTPKPITPDTVDKESNPVKDDKGVPDTVKTATPEVIQATVDNIADLADMSGITAANFTSTPDGYVTINPELAKATVEAAASSDKTINPAKVSILPIILTEVEADKIAALAFKITGAELGAENDSIVSDITIVKVLKDGFGKFTYVAEPSKYDDQCFTLKDADGKNLEKTSKIIPGTTYTLITFVKDNGIFDYDPTAGSVIDPMVVATNPPTPAPTPKGNSSGCNAGLAGLALLAFVPLIRRKK